MLLFAYNTRTAQWYARKYIFQVLHLYLLHTFAGISSVRSAEILFPVSLAAPHAHTQTRASSHTAYELSLFLVSDYQIAYETKYVLKFTYDQIKFRLSTNIHTFSIILFIVRTSFQSDEICFEDYWFVLSFFCFVHIFRIHALKHAPHLRYIIVHRVFKVRWVKLGSVLIHSLRSQTCRKVCASCVYVCACSKRIKKKRFRSSNMCAWGREREREKARAIKSNTLLAWV